MPYKIPKDKARYMSDNFGRVFTAVGYYDFSDDYEFKQKMRKCQDKHNIKLYNVWHDDHMQMVIYSSSKRSAEEIRSILREVSENFGSILLSHRTLSVELRYLLHLDDPKKVQYHPNSFIIIGNVDPLDKIIWAKEELEVYFNEIADYVESNCIKSARVLQRFIAQSRMYKYVYRKQAYKSDIDNIVADSQHAEFMEHQQMMAQRQQQHTELMSAIVAMMDKAAVPSQTEEKAKENKPATPTTQETEAGRPDKETTDVWGKFKYVQRKRECQNKHNQGKKAYGDGYVDNLDDKAYWDKELADYQQDCRQSTLV